jgi:hypothetical protein
MHRPSRLPAPAVLTYLVIENGKCITHSLDFDIVAVANTKKESWDKLQIAVRAYVEFGLGKGWDQHILFKAPPEVRGRLKPETPVEIMPSLEIANDTTPVIAVHAHDHLDAAD